jgi:hypothetical protein
MKAGDPRVAGLALALWLALGCASDPTAPTSPYVFGWPFVPAEEMEPRGGTTRGAQVEPATTPSEAWQRLREPDLSPLDRDRAAILGMAGDHRASFDFLEVVLYEPGAQPARPYRSWGTEQIRVLEQRRDFVSLQHTLVMFVVDAGGERQGPFVQKHWRQDWQYEPAVQLVHLGRGRFGLRDVSADERRGAWSQTVYQVDDSPRYASTGRWRHGPQASVWEGASAWRPLPRRERSVRSDYQVLAGRNRLTVLPTGWVHEQHNEKLVLGGSQEPSSQARELGINRYEQIVGFDFSASEAYWSATGDFWAAVRDAWTSRIEAGDDFEVAPTCAGEEGFVPSFRYAARLEAGEALDVDARRAEARRIVTCLVGGDAQDEPGESAAPY